MLQFLIIQLILFILNKFIGQSLLQQGQFSGASSGRRMVWRTPLALLSSTTKLLNMCKGIWARLRNEKAKEKR